MFKMWATFPCQQLQLTELQGILSQLSAVPSPLVPE